MDQADSNQEHQVSAGPKGCAELTAEEWRRQVLETAGRWQGEFKRPEQGDYEQRMPLK